jgi:hypothetical protein
MENLTVIIPIHQFNDEIKTYLTKAIDSVYRQSETTCDILLVAPSDTISELNGLYNDERIKLLTNESDSDYCSQINFAVKHVKTKFFSILAFDDQYSNTWFKNVEKYVNYLPEYSIFLPIVNYVDIDENIVGSMNEIIWAMSFSNEIGVIDADTLKSYYDFSPNGAVFITKDFIDVGGLKPSIKLSFWYEFLLRATNQNIKIYVIPRNGYYQIVGREGAMMEVQSKTMKEAERAWWIELASKEYYFKQERKKSYKYVPSELIDELS